MTVAGPRRISTGFLPAVALGSIAHTRATVTGGVRPAQSAAAAEQDFRSLGIRQTPPSPPELTELAPDRTDDVPLR
jgi:hypothetical protein